MALQPIVRQTRLAHSQFNGQGWGGPRDVALRERCQALIASVLNVKMPQTFSASASSRVGEFAARMEEALYLRCVTRGPDGTVVSGSVYHLILMIKLNHFKSVLVSKKLLQTKYRIREGLSLGWASIY